MGERSAAGSWCAEATRAALSRVEAACKASWAVTRLSLAQSGVGAQVVEAAAVRYRREEVTKAAAKRSRSGATPAGLAREERRDEGRLCQKRLCQGRLCQKRLCQKRLCQERLCQKRLCRKLLREERQDSEEAVRGAVEYGCAFEMGLVLSVARCRALLEAKEVTASSVGSRAGCRGAYGDAEETQEAAEREATADLGRLLH